MPPVALEAMPFLVSTGLDDVKHANQKTRKFIRSHVMRGKNTKKPLQKHPRAAVKADAPKSIIGAPFTSTIPPRVGSDVSFISFAEEVDASIIAPVLQFSLIAKKTLFPLEICIAFADSRRAWFEPLWFDAAYLHAMICSIRAFTSSHSCLKSPNDIRTDLLHLSRTIRLLRQRLTNTNWQDVPSDTTVQVVLTLAGHSHITGDLKTAEHHRAGLRKLFDLRGGVCSFEGRPKLLIEILRHDIERTLHDGSLPMFHDELLRTPMSKTKSSEAFSSPRDVDRIFAPQAMAIPIASEANPDFVGVWWTLQDFCSLINGAVEAKRKLPESILLDLMISAVYPLVRGEFAPDPVDEAFRLGLLTFCSHVLLKGPHARLPFLHLQSSYKTSIRYSAHTAGLSSHTLLWLLMIGAIAGFILEDSDSEESIYFREALVTCSIQSWQDLRDLLKSYFWIDILHDVPGQKIYDFVKPVISAKEGLSVR